MAAPVPQSITYFLQLLRNCGDQIPRCERPRTRSPRSQAKVNELDVSGSERKSFCSHLKMVPMGPNRLHDPAVGMCRAKVLRLVERRTYCELVPSGHRNETSLSLSSWHATERAKSSNQIAEASSRSDQPLRGRGTGPASKLRGR